MDRDEARKVLAAHLDPLRRRSYRDLVGLMGDVQVTQAVGPSGTEYQIEIEVMWDSLREHTRILVLGAIDDGRLPGALLPLTDSFLVGPDDTNVD
jgi:hypothetical protein